MSFDSDAPAPPSDIRQAPAPPVPPPAGPPDDDLPPRTITQEPRWPHPNLGWSLLWCILFLIVTQLPGAVIAIVVVVGAAVLAPQLFPEGALQDQSKLMKSELMNVALGLAFFITELIVIGFSWLVIRLVVGRDWTRQLALRRPGLAHTLLALASFPSLVLLGNVAYEILRHVLHVPSIADLGLSDMEEMVKLFSKWPAAFAVLVIGVGPGVGEELWCRGFLGRGLVGHYGVVFGVVATSFFFGFIHLDPCQGAMAAVMGLWLHFVYLTTRSLWLPMLLHFLNNSLAVLASRSARLHAIEEAKPSDIPVLVYVAAFLLLAAVAYALYQSRSRLAGDRPDGLLLWRPAFDGVEYPPADSGVRVAHPRPALAALALAAGAFALFVTACVLWARAG